MKKLSFSACLVLTLMFGTVSLLMPPKAMAIDIFCEIECVDDRASCKSECFIGPNLVFCYAACDIFYSACRARCIAEDPEY